MSLCTRITLQLPQREVQPRQHRAQTALQGSRCVRQASHSRQLVRTHVSPGSMGFRPPFSLLYEEHRYGRSRLIVRALAGEAGKSSGATDGQTQGEPLSSLSDAAAAPEQPGVVIRVLRGVVETVQLVLVLALLTLMPCYVLAAPPALWARAITLYLGYLLFFGGGTLARQLRHGALAPRTADAQRSSKGGRAALAVFVVLIPLLHWLAVLTSVPVSGGMANLGSGLILTASALNIWAASHLGAAYNRLVAPPALVTSGPYAFVRHPIYASYCLLFLGFSFALGSDLAGLAMMAVCAVYYRKRIATEEAILAEAFGEQWTAYAARTDGMFPGKEAVFRVARMGTVATIIGMLIVEGACALHRGPMAVRWMGTPIGAETRFAEALKTGQYVPLPKLRELRAEARDIAAERREEERANAAGSSSSGKQDQQQQRKGRDSNDGSAGVLSDGRVLATPKGPAPQGKKSAQPQQHKQ